MRSRTVGCVLGSALLAASLAGRTASAAQQIGAPGRPIFSTRSELVVLHVLVKDRRGKYVTGLPETAFTVLEDDRPQRIALFTREDSPVTVGLLVDSSGSMYDGRSRVVAAVSAFAAASNPQDEIFALTFNETVRPALPPSMPFTSDPATLSTALSGALLAYGRTALYDAVAEGLEYVARGSHPRRVLILVADGGDNASRTTFDAVLRQAQASNAAIYTVGVIDPLNRDANRERLRELARATGGEAFFPRSAGDVADVLDHIARDIRHTYTIGYVPPPERREAGFRRLRVTVAARDGGRLDVRTRTGYLAGSGGTGR